MLPEQVEVILPEGTYNKLKNTLHGGVKNPQYARVFMSLSSLLEGEFFNRYIKTGIYIPRNANLPR